MGRYAAPLTITETRTDTQQKSVNESVIVCIESVDPILSVRNDRLCDLPE